MKPIQTLVALALAAACLPALAQETQNIQRNINQQQRIQQGLQSGQLTTQEAARLQREQAAVNHMEGHALRDGVVTPAEQARLNQAQNRVSQDIYAQKHDDQVGNPNSPSSRRMQADVQRNINQQARIKHGLASGQLSGHEAARLEHGEARVSRHQVLAARDGHVSAGEQHRIQRHENRESRRIFRHKHDLD